MCKKQWKEVKKIRKDPLFDTTMRESPRVDVNDPPGKRSILDTQCHQGFG